MNTPSDLPELPRFIVGEKVTVNNIACEIMLIEAGHLILRPLGVAHSMDNPFAHVLEERRAESAKQTFPINGLFG